MPKMMSEDNVSEMIAVMGSAAYARSDKDNDNVTYSVNNLQEFVAVQIGRGRERERHGNTRWETKRSCMRTTAAPVLMSALEKTGNSLMGDVSLQSHRNCFAFTALTDKEGKLAFAWNSPTN